MKYSELVQLYFERSTALQLYWTIYVVVIGGLLAFSSLRQRKDTATVILLSVLYSCFAYKNLGAIEDVTKERLAVLEVIRNYNPAPADAADVQQLRDKLLPTLNPPEFEGVRNFHMLSDLLTLVLLWVMEWRRRKLETLSVTQSASST